MSLRSPMAELKQVVGFKCLSAHRWRSLNKLSGSNVVKAPLISGALIFNSERYSMKQGHFYFISDEFFQKYDPDHRLMQNKEDGHFRPCFLPIKIILSFFGVSQSPPRLTNTKPLSKRKLSTKWKKVFHTPNAIPFVLEKLWGISVLS